MEAKGRGPWEASGPEATSAEAVGSPGGPTDRAMDSAAAGDKVQDEWRRLSLAATQVNPLLLNETHNWVVAIEGESARFSGGRFIRARCVAPGLVPAGFDRKVLLKISDADWELVRLTTKPLKILQARLFSNAEFLQPILDCSEGDAVVVAQLNVQETECMEVAEFFSGGFRGWAQASVILHKMGIPVSVKWGVEKESACFPTQQYMQQNQQIISSVEDLPLVAPYAGQDILVHASVESNWWARLFMYSPVNAFTISSPCQPWSTAAREAGLQSADGRLLLRMADLAATFQPEVVLLEQVSGFMTHKDCPKVLEVWSFAGYDVCWRASLNLNSILPCFRMRCLLVFRLRGSGPRRLPSPFGWESQVPSTLASASAIFELPRDVQQQVTPDQQVLSMYLDPQLAPESVRHDVQAALRYRIRDDTQCATCFMAQYSYAHMLPPDLIWSKGLLGCLLRQHDVLRFFSCAEIASLHGAVLPVVCQKDRRNSVKVLGNAISTPHAAVAMLLGAKEMGIHQDVTIKQVVQECLACRIKADNSVMLPSEHGWVVCHKQQIPMCLSRIAPRCLQLQPLAILEVFMPLLISAPEQKFEVLIPRALQVSTALSAMGFPTDVIEACCAKQRVCSEVEVPFPPALPFTSDECRHVQALDLAIVSTPCACLILFKDSPLVLAQLASVAVHTFSDIDAPGFLAYASGCAVRHLNAMPSFALLLPGRALEHVRAIAPLAMAGRGSRACIRHSRLEWEIPRHHVDVVSDGLPQALFRALGWHLKVCTDSEVLLNTVQLAFEPIPSKPAVGVHSMHVALVRTLIAARVQSATTCAPATPCCEVEIQVVSHAVWRGSMPHDFCCDLLLDWWQELACPFGLTSRVRLFSGPYELPAGCKCQTIAEQHHCRSFHRASGTLLLSLHPAYQGGGTRGTHAGQTMADTFEDCNDCVDGNAQHAPSADVSLVPASTSCKLASAFASGEVESIALGTLLRSREGMPQLMEPADGQVQCPYEPDHVVPKGFITLKFFVVDNVDRPALTCHVVGSLSLFDVLRKLELQHDCTSVNVSGEVHVCIAKQPAFSMVQSVRMPLTGDRCLQVITRGRHFFLDRTDHGVDWLLHQISHGSVMHAESRQFVCCDVMGTVHDNIQEMPSTVVLVAALSPQELLPVGSGRQYVGMADICAAFICLPTDVLSMCPAQQIAAALITGSYQALLAQIKSQPITQQQLRHWIRVQLFLMPLRCAEDRCSQVPDKVGVCKVEVQVVATTVWEGLLPDATLPQQIEQWWAEASHQVGIHPAARCYSGAFSLQPFEPLSALLCQPGPGRIIRRRTSALLLTVMPAFHGGGAKEDKKQTAQAQTAQLCLSNGYTLQEANQVTAQLAQQVGQQQLSKALDSANAQMQWERIQELLQTAGIKCPPVKEVSARVTRRVAAQARKRQLFAPVPKAADFSIAGGFFLNQDGTEATVLRTLAPGTSGIILLDADTASNAIQDLGSVGPDEYAILSLGHTCPDPSSCERRLKFPACARGDDAHVLLMGCLHNLAERKITVCVKRVPEVHVAETVVCAFSSHQDEWPDQEAWDNLVSSPVKTILEQFRQDGDASMIRQPWGRIFKLDGKITAPSHCNFVQFQAHVPSESLPSLLRLSGHRRAYIVPRDAEGQLLPGWAVVWVSQHKAEALRASLSVRDQAGVVRAKGRYGIRVPESSYETTFKLLKPQSEPQPRVQVKHLYRICPVPAGANEKAILEWATLQAWPLKVLKALGPREWLVGASSPPPDGWMTFNNETILTIEVPQKHRQQQVVQAGNRPSAVPVAPIADQSKAQPSGSDPWLHTDPWMEYAKHQSRASASKGSAVPAPARQLPSEAPIANKFQAQDDRLQKLEAAVQSLQAGQEEQSRQAKLDKAAMNQSLTDMGAQFAKSLEAMQAAAQRQQEQLCQGMAELKSIVLSAGQGDSHKKQRKSNHEQMSVDGSPRL